MNTNGLPCAGSEPSGRATEGCTRLSYCRRVCHCANALQVCRAREFCISVDLSQGGEERSGSSHCEHMRMQQCDESLLRGFMSDAPTGLDPFAFIGLISRVRCELFGDFLRCEGLDKV